MKIALVQQKAEKDREDNIQRGLKAMETAAAAGANLVCFAELAFEPFYPQSHADTDVRLLAEAIPGPVTNLFCAKAKELRVVTVLNLFERDGDRCYDTSPTIDVDGSILGLTRMVHITDYDCFHEKDYYSPGDTDTPVYKTAIGNIGVAICYDRHYPEYMRGLALNGAGLVVVPQAGAVGEWPEGLYEAEMRVAAFHNGFFLALCNRVGKEEKVEFAGESFVCGPNGTVLARAGQGTDEILYVDVDLADTAWSPARTLFIPDRRPELYRNWLWL